MNYDGFANRILTTLYAAPMQPELWSVFLEELAAMIGVTKAALIAHDAAEGNHKILAALSDDMKESMHLYEDYYWQFDEWTLQFPKREVEGRIFLGEEIWPEESLRKSTFYNEFLKKVDISGVAGVAGLVAPGIFDVLSIYRGPREDSFDLEQLAVLGTIAPYLRLAFATRRRLLALESRVGDLENALDQLQTALVLVDGKGRPVLVNKIAQAILDQRSGLLLERSMLCASSATESSRLRDAISSTIATSQGKGHRSGGAMLISRPNRRPLQILVAPFGAEASAVSGKAVAVVFINDPEQKFVVPSEALRLLFGLTLAEVRLALAMLDGKSLSEVADLHRVGQETVRTQIKSIFQKTGTRRQGELISLLAGLSHKSTTSCLKPQNP